jgi:hypothetical protein
MGFYWPLIEEGKSPCRIEPSFQLLRLPSLASHVFRLMPWRIEPYTAGAVFMSAASIAVSLIAEPMCAVAWASVPRRPVQ